MFNSPFEYLVPAMLFPVFFIVELSKCEHSLTSSKECFSLSVFLFHFLCNVYELKLSVDNSVANPRHGNNEVIPHYSVFVMKYL